MTEFRCEQTVVLQVPIEMVYDYVSDFPRHLEWNQQIIDMAKSTAGPVGVGSVFRSKEGPPRNSPWLMKLIFPWLGKLMGTTGYTEAEITALDPNRRVAWTANAPLKKGGHLASAEWEICLEPQGQGTRVVQRVHFQALGMMARMDPEKLSQQVGEEMATNLNRLEAILKPRAKELRSSSQPAFA